MSSGELLGIHPQDLQFPFELNKQIPCSMQLTNKTDKYVAFKVKTTSPRNYSVRPNVGIIPPNSTCDVTVTMQAQKKAPADLQCRDKFLLQSVVTRPEVTVKDITADMFNRETGMVDEFKVKATYVSPPQHASPVREESDEGSTPAAPLPDNGSISTSSVASRAHIKSQNESIQASAIISKLREERSSAIQRRSKLQLELELLKRERSKSQDGIPMMYVFIVGLIGILVGYLVKRT